MNIWDESKVVIFIAFVVPGFIAIKAYELLAPARHADSSKQVIDAISYSCLNYAILFWPISLIEKNSISVSHPNVYLFFWLFVLFLAPILWVVAWRLLRQWSFVQNIIPHPIQKPWDFVFSQRHPCWIIVTLKDGEKVAGKFGHKSFASSAPSEEQIYLEEEWLLNEDGGFERQAEQSAGIIILSSEIRSVELYNSGDEKHG